MVKIIGWCIPPLGLGSPTRLGNPGSSTDCHFVVKDISFSYTIESFKNTFT